ncbi:MAG: uroporphyrinogen decarboxylase family protein [Planctomycetota bacterium]|jgi:hypothetical protein
MTNRERFRAIMNFESFDRLPILEWAGWWNQTLDRWHGEGLPAELTDRYAICEHLGLDIYRQDWVSVRGPDCPTEESHGAGIIENEADYEKVREHLFPPNAVDVEMWKSRAAEQERGEVALWFTVDGFFWFPRKLLGIERHLYAFYDQPELMHRINADLSEWILGVLDQIFAICTPDFMTFAEDMSYNHGPMLSRELFDEFLTPYYDRVVPRLREKGCFVFVDSDGDITAAAPWFLDAGIQGILPLERQSGLDIAALRVTHPEIRLIGAYDKMVMNRGEAAMRAEFERLLPVAAQGGLAVACDHQTPPGVSLEDYKLYLRLFHEYAERAGEMSRARQSDRRAVG